MNHDPIVITGVGLVTPLAVGAQENWSYLLRGKKIVDCPESSGAFWQRLNPYFRAASLATGRQEHRIYAIARAAIQEALKDAQIGLNSLERAGFCVSVSKCLLERSGERQEQIQITTPDAVGEQLRSELQLRGPFLNIIAACATGLYSLETAILWMESGWTDCAIAGAAESSLDPLYIAGFKQLGVLSKNPQPLDQDRDGFIMGEGAGVVVLERYSRAKKRNAKIYAAVEHVALGSDWGESVRFVESGESIAKVLSRCLKVVGNTSLDYINLHGTGTQHNDRIETRALATVGLANVPLSSTKGATGHLLGASAAVETVLTALALRNNTLPHTAGCKKVDNRLKIGSPILNHPQQKEIQRALTLSFGFGGSIAAAILHRCD